MELEKKHKRAVEELQKRREENIKLAVIAEERSELQKWINTFKTLRTPFYWYDMSLFEDTLQTIKDEAEKYNFLNNSNFLVD